MIFFRERRNRFKIVSVQILFVFLVTWSENGSMSLTLRLSLEFEEQQLPIESGIPFHVLQHLFKVF